VAEGLSASQFGVLRLLADDPGLTGAELARRSSVAAPSMNEMLSMLLRDGYITRLPDPRGGRGIQMFISTSGLSVLVQATPLLAELSEELLAGIDATRLADFFELAHLIADRAESYGRVDVS
jgi:DNA-binding MarR family transcriptional regulator